MWRRGGRCSSALLSAAQQQRSGGHSSAYQRAALAAPVALLLGWALGERVFDSTALSDAPPPAKIRLTKRFTRRTQKKYHRYVIVGAGTTAHAAIEAIRQEDPQADILVLSDEKARPRMDTDHDDVGLSEPLRDTYNEWRRQLAARLEGEPLDPRSYKPDARQQSSEQPQQQLLTVLLDTNTMEFDVDANRILLGDGTEIRYEKCLIASSGRPRHFYVLDSKRLSYALKDRINTCTTLHDFAQLDQLHQRLPSPDATLSVMVVGAGFLGTEVATALATDPRNTRVRTKLIFAEHAPASRSLPMYLSRALGQKLERAGVELLPDHLITSLKCDDKQSDEQEADMATGVVVKALGNGQKRHFDSDVVVLASTHTDPNLRLARSTGLEMDEKNGGIVVNAQLEAVSGLFVAGSAASYFDPYLGRRRVDRYDHAVNSGLVAGRNMVASGAPPCTTGRMKIYRHQPLFRSNLRGIDVLIEGLGEIDSSMRTVGVWMQPPLACATSSSSPEPSSFDRGVVYYLKGNKIMGILLWNASDLLESARQLMLSRPEIHGNMEQELTHVLSLAPDEWLRVLSTP